MVNRLALLIGAVASAGVLAVAFAANGLGTPAQTTTDLQDQTVKSFGGDVGVEGSLSADTSTGPVKTVVDKVYIAPAPDPDVVRVPKPGKPHRQPTEAVAPNDDENEQTENDDGAEHRDGDGEHESENDEPEDD